MLLMLCIIICPPTGASLVLRFFFLTIFACLFISSNGAIADIRLCVGLFKIENQFSSPIFSPAEMTKEAQKIMSRSLEIQEEDLGVRNSIVLVLSYLFGDLSHRKELNARLSIDKVFNNIKKEITAPQWLNRYASIEFTLFEQIGGVEQTFGCNNRKRCGVFCAAKAVNGVRAHLSWKDLLFIQMRQKNGRSLVHYLASDPLDWQGRVDDLILHTYHAIALGQALTRGLQETADEITRLMQSKAAFDSIFRLRITTNVSAETYPLAMKYAWAMGRISIFDDNKEMAAALHSINGKVYSLDRQSLVKGQSYAVVPAEYEDLWQNNIPEPRRSAMELASIFTSRLVFLRTQIDGRHNFYNVTYIAFPGPSLPFTIMTEIKPELKTNFKNNWSWSSLDQVLERSVIEIHDLFSTEYTLKKELTEGRITFEAYRDGELNKYINWLNIFDFSGDKFMTLVDPASGGALVITPVEFEALMDMDIFVFDTRTLAYKRRFIDESFRSRELPFTRLRRIITKLKAQE